MALRGRAGPNCILCRLGFVSPEEYIIVLWRIITVEGIVIAALVGVVWRHIINDRKTGIELQRCKDALGLNGPK